MKNLGNLLWGRLFPLPFMITGGLLLFFGLRSVQRAKESEHWPSVAGVIVSSEIDTNRGDEGTTYSAEILYDYSVNEVLYSSNQINYGEISSSDPSSARKIVNRYSAGDEVKVFYLEGDPEESVLEPGITAGAFFLPSFGAVFFIAGVGMFIFLPKLLKD